MALERFLRERRCGKDDGYTHLSLEPSGKYKIGKDEIELLYELVEKEEQPRHILESRTWQKSGPLLIDLDFKYEDNEKYYERRYNEEEINKFIDLIHTTIVYFFGTSQLEEIEYVISEKPKPTIEKGKYVKDGIHIYGRGLIMSYEDQYKLRQYAIQKNFLQDSFNMDDVKNSPDDVYDKSVISTNSWYLLGCSKPGREPYLPTKSLMIDEENELIMRRVEKEFYAIKDLSIQGDFDKHVINCLNEKREEWKTINEIVKTKTNGKNSIMPKNEIIELPDSVSQVKTEIPYSEMTGGKPAFIESIEALEKLVSIWSRERAIEYEKWRNAIFCISSCGKLAGEIEKARKIAHEFSKGPKYDKIAVDKVFNSESKGTLNFIVAHQWARMDNLPIYMSSGFSVWWKIPWGHFTLAREFYGLFPEKFLLHRNHWYMYNGVYWKKESETKNESKTIKKWISTKLYDILYEQIKCHRDSMESTIYQRKLMELNQLLSKPFKDSVLSELGQFYENNDIKFDTRPELFAFNNKIFNLDKYEWETPLPDMYISITCGYDWKDVAELEIRNMENWIGELFDSVEKKEYLLSYLASCLYRYNREEKIHFFLGRGRNGKGTLKELMNGALGNYGSKIDIAYFTTPDKSCGSANAHVYGLKDLRTVWIDEAETDGNIVGKFSTGRVKALTGRDAIKVRDLWNNKEVTFEMGHIIALVNEMPLFTSYDFALKTRIVCIRFPYSFMPSEDYNPDDPTHRKQDPKINETVLNNRNAFIALLLKWYKKYNDSGLIKPECIIEETKIVTDAMDEIGSWLRQNLIFESGTKIPVVIIHNRFLEDNQENQLNISLNEFSKRLKRLYDVGRCRANDEYNQCSRIINYKLK
jgi:phage/plasmid-associated DNA primase